MEIRRVCSQLWHYFASAFCFKVEWDEDDSPASVEATRWSSGNEIVHSAANNFEGSPSSSHFESSAVFATPTQQSEHTRRVTGNIGFHYNSSAVMMEIVEQNTSQEKSLYCLRRVLIEKDGKSIRSKVDSKWLGEDAFKQSDEWNGVLERWNKELKSPPENRQIRVSVSSDKTIDLNEALEMAA